MREYGDETLLALAGVAQSAILVDRLARRGEADEAAVFTAVHALLEQHPDSPGEVIGPAPQYRIALQSIPQIFSVRDPQFQLPMRYLVQMLHLQKQLLKRSDLSGAVAAGIASIRERFPLPTAPVDPALVSELSRLYQDTLSKLSFRIQVHGDHGHLQRPEVADAIRALLFSGVRYAVLWRQLGGRRLDFLLARNRIAEAAARLRIALPPESG